MDTANLKRAKRTEQREETKEWVKQLGSMIVLKKPKEALNDGFGVRMNDKKGKIGKRKLIVRNIKLN